MFLHLIVITINKHKVSQKLIKNCCQAGVWSSPTPLQKKLLSLLSVLQAQAAPPWCSAPCWLAPCCPPGSPATFSPTNQESAAPILHPTGKVCWLHVSWLDGLTVQWTLQVFWIYHSRHLSSPALAKSQHSGILQSYWPRPEFKLLNPRVSTKSVSIVYPKSTWLEECMSCQSKPITSPLLSIYLIYIRNYYLS